MSTPSRAPRTEIATFAGGCFWCVEAVLEQLDGVLDVTSGYMGGTTPDPTYKQVCTGTTGHAEVVQVRFDPERITYEALLDWFFRSHDPTTLNRQGADVGTQYRSAIFVHSPEQRAAAERAKQAAAAQQRDPIVTEVTDATTFYPAEDYHQDYYRQNKQQGYCRVVIAPKLGKLGLEQ
jgi:peptide-methionine (S)-S-oxide reductase